MEIAAILAMMPPAMAPAFELCRPTGTGVPVLEGVVVEAETETDELELLDAPSTVPGPSSGESIKVKTRT
jgi:hypothetical protein